ncbi:MAG: RluA family pseudouridine synthase [Lysobacterales bacterium]|jgi:RluA family pseudouridine synthase
MPEERKDFKRPPKKHQPRGMSILYEDEDIIVVNKVSGLLTMGHENEKENTAYCILNNYVRKGNQKSRNRVFIVHRLDRDTSGVLIFAKSEKAKRHLQDEWQNFKKTYLVIVHGLLKVKERIITSYLAENNMHQMYSVDDPKEGKLAKTGYKVLREAKKFSLLEVDLLTGRKNQIRVHLSEAGCPVVGDKKYGGKRKGGKGLALHSESFTFTHPHTKKELTFQTDSPDYFKLLVY